MLIHPKRVKFIISNHFYTSSPSRHHTHIRVVLNLTEKNKLLFQRPFFKACLVFRQFAYIHSSTSKHIRVLHSLWVIDENFYDRAIIIYRYSSRCTNKFISWQIVRNITTCFMNRKFYETLS